LAKEQGRDRGKEYGGRLIRKTKANRSDTLVGGNISLSEHFLGFGRRVGIGRVCGFVRRPQLVLA
jgi:hypothetical protein